MAMAPHPPIEVRGRAASPGLALGPLVVLAELSNVRRAKAEPDAEAADLSSALEAVAAELTRLAAGAGAEGAHILEVQIAMLDDGVLKDPALTAIAHGAAADAAWAHVLDEQIRDFETADDEYFRARASDLRDVRDRVVRRLRGA